MKPGSIVSGLLIAAVSTGALGQTFPASRLPALDLYLSNFAEALHVANAPEMQTNFDVHAVSFVASYGDFNSKGRSISETTTDLGAYLTFADVQTIVRRYFGRSVTNLEAAIDRYYREFSEMPEERLFAGRYARMQRFAFSGREPLVNRISRAFRVRAVGRGTWLVDAVEYEAVESLARKDHAVMRCMVYRIGPNRYDSNRWAMLEAIVIPRKEMERRLGITNFRIPRWRTP